MPPTENIILVPASQDILEVAAQHITSQCNSLPDLSQTVVLLPELQFATQLRLRLLDKAEQTGHAALLGPVITTPDHWLRENTFLDQQTPGRAHRELLLVEVLQQHPDVFGGNDPWRIAASLVVLFEELTLHRVSIPDNIDDFITRLQSAYGIADRLPEPLGMEAGIVHRLWKAWHQQLLDDKLLDPGAAHLQRLSLARSATDSLHFYLVGFDNLTLADAEWMVSLLAAGQAHCVLYRDSVRTGPLSDLAEIAAQEDSTHSTPAATRCLDTIFSPGIASPAERAAALAADYASSPLETHLSVHAALSAELEARAIDVQVRQWLLDGKQPLGIVTEDRRLARRVRALLERAGISPRDIGGWALSTTSAAAALERWLETVEEDFAHQPLLDVLKSPFSFPDEDPGQFSSRVYRFEQDIILHENIARGLERYRNHIELRQRRLPDSWSEQTAAGLQVMLNQLDQAAEPLREFIGTDKAEPAQILESLKASLEALGMWSAFEEDPAGIRIISEWQLLYQAALHSQVNMSWLEFRSWLGSTLEAHDFSPSTGDSPVMLLTVQQAQPGNFAGLIIGACDREYLPARATASPFFNDPVRSDLGLPVWPDQYELQLTRFRRLLECAPEVLMTWHREANGEPRMPGPWLSALQTFHKLGWDHDLEHPTLGAILEHPDSQVRGNHPLPVPVPAGYPAPVLPAEHLPASVSVSTHDDLIDCPYRFFAASGLGLKPREAIREALEKAGYGERIHRCLEVFHRGKEPWPPAFDKPVTLANRAAAIAALEKISQAVFTLDLEDNFEHRAWLRRWLDRVPGYIDWQIGRQQEWQFESAEQQEEIDLGNNRTLRGRLDRLDNGPAGKAITDYKTGEPPRQADVESGENVQLPSYALLAASLPQRVEYLKLDDKKKGVSSGAVIEGEALEQLAGAVRDRLVRVLDAIEAGSPLPAWGDPAACKYCSMDVLCRQQAWLEAGKGE